MDCHAGREQNHTPHVRCHSSQGQHAQQACPDISRLEVALQQQWDHAANAHLGNIVIKPHSGMKVWWTCDQCPDGHPHSWKACVKARTIGSGCPQCSGRKVCKHNSLATKAPLIAAEWDPEANVGTPDDVPPNSKQPVGWLCDVCGYKWSTTPNYRFNKTNGCPKCGDAARTGKRIKHPAFADSPDPQARACLAEWDHEQNALQGNFPSNTTLRSGKQIFWLCTKCSAGQKHSWSAQPATRTGRSKSGCPCCAGKAACRCNSLQTLYPEVAAEWDHARNQSQPSDYTGSSGYLAWWFTPRRGSWQQIVNSRTNLVLQRSARLKRVQQRQESASQI